MSEPVIKIEGLGKKYRLGQRGASYATLRDSLSGLFSSLTAKSRNLRAAAQPSAELWALKDIDLQIKRGEVVGIVGRNGAGKSTLLKILSRITEPTTGRVEMTGRVGSLLEVGTGFHPELTGRENIYLNGSIIGMKKREIDLCFDRIVEFAEIERFIDTPVKFYSSGMYVRLAFAVAAHLEPEILLVDEVLAVGDMQFQKKCLGKMHDVAGRGRTVLFVSHNMAAVKRLCSKGVFLEAGELKLASDIDEAVNLYNSMLEANKQTKVSYTPIEEHPISIKEVFLYAEEKQTEEPLQIGDHLKVKIRYVVWQELKGTNVSFTLKKDGIHVFHTWDVDCDERLFELRPAGEYETVFSLPDFLNSGTYSVIVTCGKSGVEAFETYDDCLVFDIENQVIDGAHKSFSRRSLLRTNIKWHTEKIGAIQ